MRMWIGVGKNDCLCTSLYVYMKLGVNTNLDVGSKSRGHLVIRCTVAWRLVSQNLRITVILCREKSTSVHKSVDVRICLL